MTIPFDPGVWFFPNAAVLPIQDGVWYVGENTVCKRYADKSLLAKEIRLCGHLEEQGLPVTSTLQTVDELDWFACNGSFYHLMKRLTGKPLSFDSTQPEQDGILLGRALMQTQLALASYPRVSDFPDRDLAAELPDWTGEDADAFRAVYPSLPRQLIHRDFHAGNLLFEDGRLTGVLDFELVRTEARLWDICYCVEAVLHDLHLTADPDRWYRMLAGLTSVCALTEAERAGFVPMLCAIAVVFAGYLTDEKAKADSLALRQWLWRQRDVLQKHLR